MSWYNRALVLVLPSRLDGYGLVVNEAMACGTPVIVSDRVGASDTVKKAGAGLVFPSGNAVILANCIRRLIVDDELVRKLGKMGYDYANQELDWKQVSRKYLSVFKQTT